MNKQLYTGFSFYEIIWTLFLRLASVFGLVYSLSHYDENPILIIIVAGLCLLFIFIVGDDQIVVYEDRITQKNNSILSIILKSKGQTFEIRNIKAAYLQPSSSLTDVGAAVLLAILLPKQKTNTGNTHPIFFDLKSGDTVKFDTYLEMGKMKKIVDIVNSLVK